MFYAGAKWKISFDDKRKGKAMILLLGYGFIGSTLYRDLIKFGYKVRVFSKYYPTKKIPSNFLRGDLADIEKHPKLFKNIKLVVHLAHTTVPVTSMDDMDYDVRSNVLPFIKLLKTMVKTKVKKIIFVSSGGAIYGKAVDHPMDEGQPTNPISSYGITKLVMEKYLHLFNHNFGIRSCVLRPSNAYGIGQDLKKPQGIIGYMIDAILHGKTFTVWGNGSAKKDFLEIRDLSDAILKVIKKNEFRNQIYNISYGKSYSIKEIINLVEVITGKKLSIKYSPSKKFDVQSVSLDNANFRRKFHWVPRITVEKGIENLISNTKK